MLHCYCRNRARHTNKPPRKHSSVLISRPGQRHTRRTGGFSSHAQDTHVLATTTQYLVVPDEVLETEVGLTRAKVRRQQRQEGIHALVNALVRFLGLKVSQRCLRLLAEQCLLRFADKYGISKNMNRVVSLIRQDFYVATLHSWKARNGEGRRGGRAARRQSPCPTDTASSCLQLGESSKTRGPESERFASRAAEYA